MNNIKFYSGTIETGLDGLRLVVSPCGLWARISHITCREKGSMELLRFASYTLW